MKELFLLFVSFAKIGGFTFGGGYAMLPMLQREVVEKYGWATEEELMDYYAIGQCTPGIIAVNVATFVGAKLRGVWGGIIATLGVVFPSVVIISLIAALLSNFADLIWVQNAFSGIRVCVCVLIFNAVVKLYKGAVVDKITLGMFLVIFALMVFFDLPPVLFVVLAGLAGFLIRGLQQKKGGERK